jgi:hypothetical protein
MVELVRASGTEWKAEMLTQTDERMERRFAEMHRRVHSDFMEVGAGIRAEMQQLEVRVGSRIQEVELKLGQLEVRLGNKIQECELKNGQHKVDMIRWMVGLLVVQAGLMVIVAWAGKHIM